MGRPKKKTENIVEMELSPETINTLKVEAEKSQRSIGDVAKAMLTEGFDMAVLDVGESVVTLKTMSPWSGGKVLDPIGEDGEETQNNLNIYRRLRENFAPVTAGIDYHKVFTVGSGLSVKVENLNDEHQAEMKKIIETFNAEVFMDDVTIGLDAILDIHVDDAFTDGVGAAEIVYEGWDDEGFKFEDFADKIEYDQATIDAAKKAKKVLPQYKPREMTPEDWAKLKGIKQLKIVSDAYTRLKPYREATSWNILYYTLDEEPNPTNKKVEKDIIKLLPWQVFWVSWNRRNNKLKGKSMIKPVADVALLLEKTLKDLGVSIDRWADKKFFFILGDAKQGRSWSPQSVRNFLQDMDEMTKKGKSGIPVNAGFDVKSIGGEIYDGGNVVNDLISLICAGMKYPRTFLEMRGGGAAGQESDKMWLAWQVMYGRQQAQLKRAVEYQLWRRHLFCKIGPTRVVKKQGVKPEDQPKVNIYVPKLEWSSEGRWAIESKLKMLKDWLNVANPVTPQFKMWLELDAAKTFGYNELSFEAIAKQLQTQTAIDSIQKQIDLTKKEMELEAVKKAQTDKTYLENPAVLTFVQSPAQQAAATAKEGGEKTTGGGGNPTLQTEVVKRQAGGAFIRKKPTGVANRKGIAKPPGTTRTPKVGESEELGESEEEIEVSEGEQPQRFQLDINVKGETEIKPIEVHSEPTKLEVSLVNPEEDKTLENKVKEEQIKTEQERQETERQKRKAFDKLGKTAEKVGE